MGFIQWLCVLNHFTHVPLFVTLWTVARQAPLSMGFSRQEYWSGLPRPPPGALPDPGIKPALAGPLPLGPLWKPIHSIPYKYFFEHLCARCCTGHYRTQQGTKSLSPWNTFSSGSTYVVLLKL